MVAILSGEETFVAPRDVLWQKLTDMDFLSRCIPNTKEILSLEDKKFKCRVQHGFAFIKGSVELSFELIESKENDHTAVFLIRGRGIGSSSLTQVYFTLCCGLSESETRVKWGADVLEKTGLLKPVGDSLVRAAAEKIVTDCLKTVREKLSNPA